MKSCTALQRLAKRAEMHAERRYVNVSMLQAIRLETRSRPGCRNKSKNRYKTEQAEDCAASEIALQREPLEGRNAIGNENPGNEREGEARARKCTRPNPRIA